MKHKLISFISILLVLLTFLGTVTFSVYADIGNSISNSDLESEFLAYCKKQLPDIDYDYKVTIFKEKAYEDMIIFMGDCGAIPSLNTEHVTDWGDWISLSTLGSSDLSVVGIYVKVEETILSLESAYEQGIITDLSPVAKLASLFYHIGDVNGDKKVNIKDATRLQKHLAGLNDEPIIDSGLLQTKVLDMNKDGKISIQDATSIQKYIAKADY